VFGVWCLPTTCCGMQYAVCCLLPVCCLLSTAYCLLPTAYSLSAYCLLPTAVAVAVLTPPAPSSPLSASRLPLSSVICHISAVQFQISAVSCHLSSSFAHAHGIESQAQVGTCSLGRIARFSLCDPSHRSPSAYVLCTMYYVLCTMYYYQVGTCSLGRIARFSLCDPSHRSPVVGCLSACDSSDTLPIRGWGMCSGVCVVV
jgi:hypothetical protein